MRQHTFPLLWALALVLGAAARSIAQSSFEPNTGELCTAAGCPAVIAETVYDGHRAYRLCDGHSEAIVVPDLGRIMSYRLVGGPNLLWTATRHKFGAREWKNYGGAKTWPSPQNAWPALIGRKWPPPEMWENTAKSEVLTGGTVRLTSATDPATGTRLVREFGLADDGDLTISQTVEKLTGQSVTLGMWSVTQTEVPDFVLMPRADSANGYRWLDKPDVEPPITTWANGVLRVSPTTSVPSDLAADASQAWMVSVINGTAFSQRSVMVTDGADNSNYKGTFPVAFYCTGPQKQPYSEVELLSPLHRFQVGSRLREIQSWRVEALPSPDFESSVTRSALTRIVEGLRKSC